MKQKRSQKERDARHHNAEKIEHDYQESIAQLEKRTAEIEAEKERKRFAREERKFLKEHKKKQEKLERFVAPVLLLVTILVSYLVMSGILHL